MRLGNAVNQIRTSSNFVRDRPDRRKQLNDLGFVWDDLARQWEIVKDALVAHKQIHGNMTVVQGFVVPFYSRTEDWPEETWGLKLGQTVNQMRSSNVFVDGNPERRQWLDDEGFVWALLPSYAARIREAASRYKRRRAGANTAPTSTE
jgi:hypothetical protein